LHFGKHKNDDKTKKSFKQMEGDWHLSRRSDGEKVQCISFDGKRVFCALEHKRKSQVFSNAPFKNQNKNTHRLHMYLCGCFASV
jgi:hypothetical protein